MTSKLSNDDLVNGVLKLAVKALCRVYPIETSITNEPTETIHMRVRSDMLLELLHLHNIYHLYLCKCTGVQICPTFHFEL